MRGLCDTVKAKERNQSAKTIKRSEPDVSSVEPAPQPEEERLLTSGEAGRIHGVKAVTMRRWANAGRLTVKRTLGGHRRYRESEVRRLVREQPATA